MACKLKRNQNQEILEVELRNGAKSKLFDNLASKSIIDSQKAFDIFNNIYSKKVKDFIGDWEINLSESDFRYDTGEPKVFYKNNTGLVSSSYAEVLKNTNTGNISVGIINPNNALTTQSKSIFEIGNNDVISYKGQIKINNPNAFLTLGQIDSYSNPLDSQGFLNNMIRQDLLSEDQVVKGDKRYHKAKGQTSTVRGYNTALLREEAVSFLGTDSVEVFKKDLLTFTPKDNTEVELVDSKGSTTISKEKLHNQLLKGDFTKLSKRFPGFIKTAYNVFLENFDINKQSSEINNSDVTEKDIRIGLLNTLTSLGISSVSISEYIENYNVRNGVDPDVEALADIANKVVAFAEGRDTNENIAEELSHFIIEGFEDQLSVEQVLSEVEQTSYWTEHSSTYYAKYSDLYSGDKLDNVVRREVLGKMLKDKILDNFRNSVNSQDNTVISTLRDLWNSFISKVRAFITPSTTRELENLTEILANKVADQKIVEQFDTELLEKSGLTLFSLSNKTVITNLKNVITGLDQRLRDLKTVKSSQSTKAEIDLNRLKEINSQMNNYSDWYTVRVMLGAVEPMTKPLRKRLAHLREYNANNPTNKKTLTPEERSTVRVLRDFITPTLAELRKVVETDLKEEKGQSRQQYMDDLDSAILDIESIIGGEGVQATEDFDTLVDRIVDKYNLSKLTDSQQEELGNINSRIDQINTELNSEGISDSETQSLREEKTTLAKRRKVLEDANQEGRLRKEIEDQAANETWFHKTFGSLEHSKNIFNRLLGLIISEMNNKINLKFQKSLNPFLQQVAKGQWNQKAFERLISKKKDGKFSNFVLDMFDHDAYLEAKKDATRQAYNKALKLNLDKSTYTKALASRQLKKTSEFTADELVEYNTFMSEWRKENNELQYTQDFSKTRERLYKNLNISANTQEVLKNLSTRRYAIIKNSTENGQVDYFKLKRDNPELAEELADISVERKAAKSLFDVRTGELKTGRDLQVAQELQRMDAFYALSKSDNIDEAILEFQEEHGIKIKKEEVTDLIKETKVKDSFLETLKKVEKDQGSQAAFDWLRANGGLTFNSNFWEELSNGKKSITEKLDLVIDQADSSEVERLTRVKEELQDLLDKKSTILRQYQTPNNPSEVQADLMYQDTMKVLKEVEERLGAKFSEVNKIIQDNLDIEEIGGEGFEVENSLNESYFKMLEDSVVSEIEFIKKHTTDRSKADIDNVKRELERFSTDGYFNFSRQTLNFLENKFGEEAFNDELLRNFLEDSDIESLVVEFGRTKVLSYFKRFAPQGYNNLLENLKTGRQSVSSFVENSLTNNREGIEQYIDVSPQFAWTEDVSGENHINKNYNPNYEGGINQPSISKYLNDQYFEHFGINKQEFLDNYRQGVRTPIVTKNEQDFDMLQQLISMKREGLKAYGELGFQNIYKLPQVRQGSVARASNLITKGNASTIVDSVKDLIYDQVDELGYGQTLEDGTLASDESSARLVPKLHLRDLDNPLEVSHELALSYGKFLQGGLTFEGRQEALSEVYTLKYKINQTAIGTPGKNTRAVEMFDNAMNAYFFGVQKSRKLTIPLKNGKELDLSGMVMTFDKWVRSVNIGFSLPVAVTGYLSGEVFLTIDRLLGQNINKQSTAWAAKTFRELTPKLIAQDTGEINKTSKLNLIFETFRAKEIDDKLTSSGFNKFIRTMNNLPFKFAEIGDLPITGRIVLSILDDFRFVDGNLTKYSSYKVQELAKGKSLPEINEAWEQTRENSLYNSIDFNENNALEFKQEVKEQFTKEQLDNFVLQATNTIRAVKSNIDTVVPQEDRSAATRDFTLKLLTAHRGWLSIAIQRRLKSNQFNFISGVREEGHYRGFVTFLNNMFAAAKENNFKEIIKVLKEEWNLMSDLEQKNVGRIMLELGAYMFLATMGLAVAKFADDEDNKDIWLLQFAAYNYFRTVSEVGSIQAPFGIVGLKDVVKTPFVAVNTLDTLLNTKGYSLKEVKRGAYAGHTKLYKTFAKNTWLRHAYGLQDIKSKSDYYRLMNNETLMFLGK